MKARNLTRPAFLALAKSLALKYNNSPKVIGLTGPLGAGKTTFVQAFGRALGIQTVKSPSFVVMHEYPRNKYPLYHLDFYRLNKAAQLAPLGIEEILNQKNMILIEWVEKFPKIAARCDVLIQIQINPDQTRNVTIRNN